jgi:hypothetical protein
MRSEEQREGTMELKATFIPIVKVRDGDRLVGGIVTGIRFSKSRKTVYLTMDGARGNREWPGSSTDVNTAVFTETEEALAEVSRRCGTPGELDGWYRSR